jgi:3-deoxy-D-manno-octulosonic-acid transferase
MRLATPLLLGRWWWRGKAEPGYRRWMWERLGFYREASRPGLFWIHCVSLGETLAAAPLLDALRTRQPGLRLLLTHTTATGREAGAKLLQPGDFQCWLPLDTPGATRRFFAHWQPARGALMETEVWPSLLKAAENANVPVTLANARLSARSLHKGERFAPLLQAAAGRLQSVLAQTEADANRLRRMGARQVEVCGNLKFDSTPDRLQLQRGQDWRVGSQRQVLLGAVTREGEEALLIEAFAQWPTAPRPILLLVPRHPQRFDEVESLLRSAGLLVARRTQWGAGRPPTDAQAWLGDSMGEMAAYYAAADLALLGGSFAPLGGQNLIQAASCGCPLLMGPHTFNFAEAADQAVEAGAAQRVSDMHAAVHRASALLTSEDLSSMRVHALRFAQSHQGAATRMAERLAD